MMYYSDMTSHSLGEGDGMWLIVVVTCYCPNLLSFTRMAAGQWLVWLEVAHFCAPSVCPIPLSPFILAVLSPAQLQHGKKLIGFLQAGNF